jgi:hypothetical protein
VVFFANDRWSERRNYGPVLSGLLSFDIRHADLPHLAHPSTCNPLRLSLMSPTQSTVVYILILFAEVSSAL